MVFEDYVKMQSVKEILSTLQEGQLTANVYRLTLVLSVKKQAKFYHLKMK